MDDSIKVSEDVLERLPGRALNLLSGIGKLPELRGALALRGYTHEVHNRGWKLLELAAGRALLGLPQEPEAPTQAYGERSSAQVTPKVRAPDGQNRPYWAPSGTRVTAARNATRVPRSNVPVIRPGATVQHLRATASRSPSAMSSANDCSPVPG